MWWGIGGFAAFLYIVLIVTARHDDASQGPLGNVHRRDLPAAVLAHRRHDAADRHRVEAAGLAFAELTSSRPLRS